MSLRIGRLNQILQQVIDEQKNIVVKATSVYAGQAYDITNYGEIRLAISSLAEKNLITFTNETVKTLFDEYTDTDELQVDSATYTQLTQVVQNINTVLPNLLKVIENFSPKQEENIINVKLPDGMTSIKDLNEYNSRIEKIFTRFKISKKDIKIVGFDNGSEWYQILLENVHWVLPWVISCIDLALHVIEFKRKKEKDPETNIQIITINNYYKSGKKDEVARDDYIENLATEETKREIDERIEQMGAPGGHEPAESATMLVKATKELVKEFEAGTQFHLSLNPPEYIKNQYNDASFTIDYSSIPKVEQAEEEETAELPEEATASTDK
jgi:hypothetical protein